MSHTTCGSKTCGLRRIRACFTSSRSFRCSCASRSSPAPTGLFLQLTQLQPLQNTSDAKHSQYSFKHRDFRQLHVCFYPQKGETGKPNEWDREKIRQSWTLQVRAAAHAQATPLWSQTPITATESRGFRRGARLVLHEKTLYLRHGSRDRPRAPVSAGPCSAPRRLFLLRCRRPA